MVVKERFMKINLLFDLLMRYTDMLNEGFSGNYLNRSKKNSDDL